MSRGLYTCSICFLARKPAARKPVLQLAKQRRIARSHDNATKGRSNMYFDSLWFGIESFRYKSVLFFLILMITLYVGRGIENLLRISQFYFLIFIITLYVGRGIGRRQKRHRLKAFQPYKILTKQNRTE